MTNVDRCFGPVFGRCVVVWDVVAIWRLRLLMSWAWLVGRENKKPFVGVGDTGKIDAVSLVMFSV